MSGFENIEVCSSVLELENVLRDINSSPYKKIWELEIGKLYCVHKIEIIKTQFGKRVCVECSTFKFLLPKSWNSRMTDYNIQVINNTNSWVFVTYKGFTNKYEVEFTM